MALDKLLYPLNKKKNILRFIEKNQDTELGWIIILKPSRADEGSVTALLEHEHFINVFPAIYGFSFFTTAREIHVLSKELEDNIEQIWYYHPKLFYVYDRFLAGATDLLSKGISNLVINLSLTPPSNFLPLPFLKDEPISRQIEVEATLDISYVCAAGNEGPELNTLSPWGLSPYSMSIGASDLEGRQLADFSSRGIPNDPVHKPTVVCNGIDSKIRLAPKDLKISDDEFDQLPENKKYAYLSGTSYATAEASSIACQIFHFLTELNKQRTNDKGTFAHIFAHSLLANPDERVSSKRFKGEILDDDGFCVLYPLNDRSPTLIKQMMMDMAKVMPQYAPHEVGAGFISRGMAMQNFGTFGHIFGENLKVGKYDFYELKEVP